MPLRFDQFRRLRLLQSLQALPHVDGGELQGSLAERPAVPYTVSMRGAEALAGLTVRHLETEFGLFLFEPVDNAGTVRRSFIPRSAYSAVEIGQRIGEALVQDQLVTAAQVEDALAEQEQLRSRKLGDILLDKHIISREELIEAIDQQGRMPMVRIGEALMALGMITPRQLEEALTQQRKTAARRWASCWCAGAWSRAPTCRPPCRARWATRWWT
jgi:hypothetical protein